MTTKELTKMIFIVICMVISTAGCSKKEDVSPVGKSGVADVTTLLSTIADHDEPSSTDPAIADKMIFEVYFNERGRGVAYIAKTDGGVRLVHNGKAERIYDKINNVVLSPDGNRAAYVANPKYGKQRLVVDGREGRSFDDVSRPVFSPDGRHVACLVSDKEMVFIVVDDNTSQGYKTFNGNPLFSADSTRVVYSEGAEGKRKARLVISDLEFKKPVIRESCGDLLVESDDKSRIATVSDVNNKKKVIEFAFAHPDQVKEGKLYDNIAQLAFGADPNSVSYAAENNGERFLILNGREMLIPNNPLLPEPLVIRGQKGVVAIKVNRRIENAPEAFYINGNAEKPYNELRHFVYSADGSRHAYSARKGKSWAVVVNGKEGPWFDMAFKPMFSPDGEKLVYRVRQNGRRFVVVADASGTVLRQDPAYEMVFDTVFTEDGKSVAYGVKDGRKLIWIVEKLQD